MAVRLIGLTQGRVNDPMASSGLNWSVFAALARQADLVGTLDISFSGWQRYWNAALHWHPDRHIWRERFDLNVWSYQQLSRLAGQMLTERQGDFDLVFQLRTMYSPGPLPAPWPYAIMVDSTYALSDRFYPPWAPMRGKERQRWLDMERETYHSAEAVFARTHWVRRSLIEDFGLPEDKAIWVGTGCNFKLDSPPQPKEKDDGQTILFVGKEFSRKGVPTLLQAFAQVRRVIPDARLLLVGSQLETSQPGVEVLGKISDRERLRAIYNSASLFVLPALFEPCGNVIIEAMAHRLPCIVSTGGGLAELVQDGQTGFVVPPENPRALADRIITALCDWPLRQSMGYLGARLVYEEMNWDRVVERMQPVFERVLAKGRGGKQPC